MPEAKYDVLIGVIAPSVDSQNFHYKPGTTISLDDKDQVDEWLASGHIGKLGSYEKFLKSREVVSTQTAAKVASLQNQVAQLTQENQRLIKELDKAKKEARHG